MKKCPYCAEEILDAAQKCKHCGEFLTEFKQNETTKNKQASGGMSGGQLFGIIVLAIVVGLLIFTFG